MSSASTAACPAAPPRRLRRKRKTAKKKAGGTAQSPAQLPRVELPETRPGDPAEGAQGGSDDEDAATRPDGDLPPAFPLTQRDCAREDAEATTEGAGQTPQGRPPTPPVSSSSSSSNDDDDDEPAFPLAQGDDGPEDAEVLSRDVRHSPHGRASTSSSSARASEGGDGNSADFASPARRAAGLEGSPSSQSSESSDDSVTSRDLDMCAATPHPPSPPLEVMTHGRPTSPLRTPPGTGSCSKSATPSSGSLLWSRGGGSRRAGST